MKLNHFMIPYYGNKRNEVKKIYENIDLSDVDIIVEPFCGTSALSFYISTLHPLKYTYHLNDNNGLLIQLYEIAQDEEKFKLLVDEVDEIFKNIKNEDGTYNKEKYNKVDVDTLKGFLFKNKIYQIRPGLCPLQKDQGNDKIIKILKSPILHFLRTEKIIFTCGCGIKIINEYKNNDKALLFLDPPYLQVCNDFYANSDVNIYEYLYKNSINEYKCKLYLCLELVWIIKLLFEKYEIIEYDKSYTGPRKKNVKHGIISNVFKK